MARLTGTAVGRARAAHRLLFILGTDYTSDFVPEFTSDRFCYADRDIIYLTSISQVHEATVILEAWDGEPPTGPDAESAETTELELTSGRVYVCAMLEVRVSPVLTVGPPGRYAMRAEVAGRAELRERLAYQDMTESLNDIEHFRVRFWPVSSAG
ncbi:hypothetical protein [Micromonospora sp. DT47]|uniref:hypothetical protein n=1 Tax=Micromonospora sp. DT47 TaxID=3393431 RepID=UPI003CF8FB75